jgi:hypothetical protein
MARRRNPFELGRFEESFTRYMAEFDTDKWAQALDGVTFRTASAPLSWDEGLAIMHHYQEGCCGMHGRVTLADRLSLDSLRLRLTGLMHTLGCKSFFVRLGARSPKDAPSMPSQWVPKAKIRDALASARRPDTSDAFAVLRLFQETSASLLRVHTAADAIALLLSSERVFEDIIHTMDHGAEGWAMSLVVREWDEDVRMQHEYRGFICAGQLTALSQYDDQLGYAIERPREVLARAQSCFTRVLPSLQALGFDACCVIDFLIVPPASGATDSTSSKHDCAPEGGWKTAVIELNPFGPMTGASLFRWDVDRRILQGGIDAFGDLASCEARWRSEAEGALPAGMVEFTENGTTMRHLTCHPLGLTWERLEVFWGPYFELLKEIGWQPEDGHPVRAADARLPVPLQ